MVTFAREVPLNAQLVVYSDRRTRMLFGFMVFGAALLAIHFVGLIVIGVLNWDPAAISYFASWLLFAFFLALPFRECLGLLGPQLAADHTGIWVRTGLGPRPEVVFLPWFAIDGIDAVRNGPAVRIMSRQGEALYGRRRHWRARWTTLRYGTPFVVNGRRSAEPPDVIAHRLHQLGQWATRR